MGAWDTLAQEKEDAVFLAAKAMRERDALRVDLERLRKIEVAANAWADVVEQSEEGEGDEEFENAGHTLFHALGRTTCTSCQI